MLLSVVCQAMECYAKAARLNHVKSAYNLAVVYLQSSVDAHHQEAVKLLEQAASLGLKEVFLMIQGLFHLIFQVSM